MRMLCLAAKANPVGYVQIEGQPCTADHLSKLTGESNETVATLLSELEQWRVFSKTRAGVIYNRKMVRDAIKSRTNAKNGKTGGEITHRNKRGIFQSPGPPPRGSPSPEARSQEPYILSKSALDKAAKKARWEQKISEAIYRMLPNEQACKIVTAYTLGEQWAKDEFEKVDKLLKLKRTA